MAELCQSIRQIDGFGVKLHLFISNDIVSTKIYDKCDNFDFEIVNFSFLNGDVPHLIC